MRLMILRMISTGSLSAFSASVAQSRLGQTSPIHPARALSPSRSPPRSRQLPGLPSGSQAVPTGNRTLPRGSLLDLSV